MRRNVACLEKAPHPLPFRSSHALLQQRSTPQSERTPKAGSIRKDPRQHAGVAAAHAERDWAASHLGGCSRCVSSSVCTGFVTHPLSLQRSQWWTQLCKPAFFTTTAGYKPGVSSRLDDSADSLQQLAGVLEAADVLGGSVLDSTAAQGLSLTHNWFNSSPPGGELMYL